MVKDGQQILFGLWIYTRLIIILLHKAIRVYYLKAPAPKRGFVKEELLIVPADTLTSHL